MLYLEDYLEMIEHLPQELRDRFTLMREMDLQVQNATESLEKRVKAFFAQAEEMKPADRDAEYTEIKKAYAKALEDAVEKVQLSNNMYDLVAMYVRRLDTECHKFKMELEADHAGITEILERRSQEMDGANGGEENRPQVGRPAAFAERQERRREQAAADYRRLLAVEKLLPDVRPAAAGASAAGGYAALGGPAAIAAAATQAIAATQQMQQGRRTASLKASYEAISNVAGSVAAELAAAQTAGRRKKAVSRAASAERASTADAPPSAAAAADAPAEPEEPRYCICNEVAYGGMVACDNKGCLHEWFHYPCVGITDAPKGTWYCPQCAEQKRQQRNRKKKAPAHTYDTLDPAGVRHAN